MTFAKRRLRKLAAAPPMMLDAPALALEQGFTAAASAREWAFDILKVSGAAVIDLMHGSREVAVDVATAAEFARIHAMHLRRLAVLVDEACDRVAVALEGREDRDEVIREAKARLSRMTHEHQARAVAN